jgi:hypothetical protein
VADREAPGYSVDPVLFEDSEEPERNLMLREAVKL